ncbi:MAG: ABC transporter six-transmembrane domain-containing protein [Ignavibacteriae bacterium]|nr:ABC transporter six-transmembrane domain-containing protein [Ignavibacteriota bacterium]
MFLIDLIRRFRKGIIIAFCLVIIENVAWIIEPTMFGKVIDAVIDVQYESKENDSLVVLRDLENKLKLEKKHDTIFFENENLQTEDTANIKGLIHSNDTSHSKDTIKNSEQTESSSYVYPLMIWLIVFAVNSGLGVVRRAIDPKIFLNIYTKIATEVSQSAIKLKLNISKTATRAQLSHEYIGFLQYRIPEVLENIVAIGGAIIALYFFDWKISLTCLCIVVPVYLANKLYSKKVMVLQKEFHDNYEDIYDVFSKQDPKYVHDYYQNLAKPQKKIANWGAFNFGMMRATLMGIFLVVLYIAIDLDEFSAGELYSIVAYLWTFVTSTEYLPELMESWTSLKDISKRLKMEI